MPPGEEKAREEHFMAVVRSLETTCPAGNASEHGTWRAATARAAHGMWDAHHVLLLARSARFLRAEAQVIIQCV